MFVIRAYPRPLRELGLDSLEGVKRAVGELVVDHRGRRDVLRFQHGELVLFLKRIWKEHPKDRLWGLLRHGRPWSTARTEWHNYLALEAAGIASARPVAFGQNGGLWGFCCIITEAAAGRPLDHTIMGETDSGRRRLIVDLARWLRRMHDAGIAFPDLFARHIFVEEQRGAPRFILIDVARLDIRHTISARSRARDLAALNASIPLRQASVRLRLRLLVAYSAGDARRLLRLIERRMRRLLRRPKFADFARPG